MTDNTQKIARRRETARLCTGSYLRNLPNHREPTNVITATRGQILPTRAEVNAARQTTEMPQIGIVIGDRVRASSTDPVIPASKPKRVRKALSAEKREQYNAKKRVSAENRKYSGISYTKPNDKSKNEGYFTVSYKNCRTRFPNKHEAEQALKRYQNGECPVCGMNKPKMCPAQKKPPRDTDSDATFGTHSSESEAGSEEEVEAESEAESEATQAPTVAVAAPPAPAVNLRVHANPNGTLQVTINGVTFTCEGDFVYP